MHAVSGDATRVLCGISDRVHPRTQPHFVPAPFVRGPRVGAGSAHTIAGPDVFEKDSSLKDSSQETRSRARPKLTQIHFNVVANMVQRTPKPDCLTHACTWNGTTRRIAGSAKVSGSPRAASVLCSFR